MLRALVGAYCAFSFALALSYLRYRRATLVEYAAWGSLALLVPVLGPFFVIAARPGPRKRMARRQLS